MIRWPSVDLPPLPMIAWPTEAEAEAQQPATGLPDLADVVMDERFIALVSEADRKALTHG